MIRLSCSERRGPVNSAVRPLSLTQTLVAMRKRKLTLVAKIPNHVADGVTWKRGIYEAVTEAQRRAGVHYSDSDKLDVEVRFHLTGHKLTKLDLDNRLKAVGDALQGFINDKGRLDGGSKRKPIIPNDNQIYRLVAEKRLPSKHDLDAPSTITIRRYTGDARTVADPRETRKLATARSNKSLDRSGGSVFRIKRGAAKVE